MLPTNNLPTSFDDLLRTSELPIFVDFWAEWCGPCRTMTPAIKQLAADFKGKLLVVKINVDERPKIAAEFGIQSIPTMMIFKGGKPVWRVTGAMPYDQLKPLVQAQF
jgi:thioredoxin